MLRIYVVQGFKLLLGILGCNFFLLYTQLLLQFLLSMAQYVSVIQKTRYESMKLFQYSSIFFDLHNEKLCDGLSGSQCCLGR